MKSIAIPTIGTGRIGLNAKDVANEMLQVAVSFAQRRPKNLKKIFFMVYPTDNQSYTAFQQALSRCKIQLYTQQQLADIFTKSVNRDELNQKSNCCLIFKAQCDEAVIPVNINVYDGMVNEAKANAIVDITALCSKHNTMDNHVDFANYADSRHTLQSLRNQFLQGRKIYQICPYGCLTGFSTLLAHMNSHGESSVAIPLLDVEMNATDTAYLVDLIEFFMEDHLFDISISCFNFIIGYQDRSTEIATWIQDKIKNKDLRFGWKVVEPVSVENFGVNLYYTASDQKAIDNMKQSMAASCNTWTHHVMTDEDYFNAIKPQLWYQIRLEFWSKYSTIVIRQKTGNSVSIFGLETDIMETVSHIYKSSKTKVKEKANQDLQQFAAESSQWYAMIDSTRIKFETKLNYELEKNYSIHLKNQTAITFQVDSGKKLVNYENMAIIYSAKNIKASIGKLSFEGTVYIIRSYLRLNLSLRILIANAKNLAILRNNYINSISREYSE